MARGSFVSGISKATLERAGIQSQPGDFGSDLEADLAHILSISELPVPEREAVLLPPRKWRSDFVWREARLIVEVEGGTASGKSRHTKGKGFEDDCRKYNALTLAGWQVIRVTGAHITSGEALEWIERGLQRGKL